MSEGNGILSSMFGSRGTAVKVVKQAKQNVSSEINLSDLSPESVVTSPNFVLVADVLFGAVTVTAEMAALWIQRSVSNVRKPQEGRIGLYTEAMTKKQWDFNGETIKFDKNGALVDGQNRLLSCIESGKPFTTGVVYGIESADNVDGGKARTSAQIIQAKGLTPHANTVNAAVNYLHAYEDAGSKGFVTVGHGRHPLTMADRLSFVEQNSEKLTHSAHMAHKARKLFQLPSLHVALHFLFAQIAGQALADQFYTSLIDGTGLANNSPIYHLRERLMKDRANDKKARINHTAGMVIKGWNYWISNQVVARFHYVYESDGVPKIKKSVLSK